MIQGTSSAVGKSLLATAFCRLFTRAGHRVAPFKAQNMALNAAVADGGEIGRAQAAQADAAGVAPTVDMNPILLKPESDERSQVVVRGRAVASVGFHEYAAMIDRLAPLVQESLTRLRERADVVVIEGAGSPAEINLPDLVNMRVARMADAPVLLAGDIDRGGVFAAFVGTLALLPADDRARVAGFLVNKFRGDRSLLAPGLVELTARTGVPVLGVVPWIGDTPVPAEDSLDLGRLEGVGDDDPALVVAIPRLPRIANFDDFEPLAREPDVRLRLARTPRDVERADLVVLPGSKNTAADLAWLRERGLADAIGRAAAVGRLVLGVCGGYQMLGRAIRDPERVESDAGDTPGLGLLPAITTLGREKTIVRVRARARATSWLATAAGGELDGYEIHVGRTEVSTGARPFTITERHGTAADEADGAINDAGNVVGTYLHGLFANDALRGALLRTLAARKGLAPNPAWGRSVDASARYDGLADVVAAGCDVGAIGALVGRSLVRPPSAAT
jgi:adenosylcobyric acid synthase